MKNIWMMLLIICSVSVFTACSDDDDEQMPPVAPTATLPETLTVGQEAIINGKDFVATAKLILKNIADAARTLDIEGAEFTATSVTFTVPADVEAGNYKVIVRQNNEEYELGTVEVVLDKVEKMLTKVIFSAYGETLEYALTYGEEGEIEKIAYTVKGEDELQETIYSVKREGERILIADDDEAEVYTYTLKDGKIAGCVDAYNTSFSCQYTNNYLTALAVRYEGEEEEYVIEYEYTDNNLVAIDGGGLKFGEQKNIPNGVDPVICIYKFILTSITENSDFFPHLLGLCGNSSVNLPTSSDAMYGNLPFTYTYEEWGGIKSITCTNEEDVSTIGFEYE